MELCGEEQLTVDMMNLLEESGMIEVAQRIRMHGQVLHHRSTRQIKIEKLQDAFDTRLPPTLYPLQNMKDYDLLRSLLNDVMKVEGLGRLWQPGDNPPESVQHWWGPDDWDLFRMYRNKDIPNELMELVKSRYMVHKKNGMGFFKQKLISCYKLRVGEELVNKFNMQTSMAEIEQVKEARLARLEDERCQRQAAQEEDERRQRERETEERIQREVEERVQREIRERTRQEAILLSPERRRRGGREGEVGGGELGGRIGEEGREELRRRTEALSDLVEDPNSSVLGDPAAVAVLRAPTTEPGPSRPTRQVFKCPVAGCPITRMTEAAITVHFENAHE